MCLLERDARILFDGQGIVVEHVFAHAVAERSSSLRRVATDGFGDFVTVDVSADRLRPQAERALRGATAAGIPRDVRVLAGSRCSISRLRDTCVDRQHARHRIPIGDLGRARRLLRYRRRHRDTKARGSLPGAPFRQFQTRVVELVAADEIDDLGLSAQRLLRKHGYVRTDEADFAVGILRLDAGARTRRRWEATAYSCA